jgi:hypothetical protein
MHLLSPPAHLHVAFWMLQVPGHIIKPVRLQLNNAAARPHQPTVGLIGAVHPNNNVSCLRLCQPALQVAEFNLHRVDKWHRAQQQAGRAWSGGSSAAGAELTCGIAGQGS